MSLRAGHPRRGAACTRRPDARADRRDISRAKRPAISELALPPDPTAVDRLLIAVGGLSGNGQIRAGAPAWLRLYRTRSPALSSCAATCSVSSYLRYTEKSEQPPGEPPIGLRSPARVYDDDRCSAPLASCRMAIQSCSMRCSRDANERAAASRDAAHRLSRSALRASFLRQTSRPGKLRVGSSQGGCL